MPTSASAGLQPVRPDRPRILHLSADFPDVINPEKTPVIQRLIGLVADGYDHQVLSINRLAPTPAEAILLATGLADPAVEASVQPIEGGAAMHYRAMSRGLFHATMLRRLARWIAERVTREGPLPDLVIGHKLTVEGILASEVARLLGIPYALTIQGNTDQKILRFRPDLNGMFRKIYHGAACVFCFAPWARKAIEQQLGVRAGLTLMLPCPTVFDTIRTPTAGGNALISVFHLRNYKVKNLEGLVAATRLLEAKSDQLALQIIGGGSQDDIGRCETITSASGSISLIGPRTQDQLGSIMNGAIAMVMPSLRESFGLVFIGSLFAGLPIIYPKGASIDGYFDGLPFAIGVNARDPQDIATAMARIMAEEEAIKAALAQWQQDGGLAPFMRSAIRTTFDHGLRSALGESNPHVSAG